LREIEPEALGVRHIVRTTWIFIMELIIRWEGTQHLGNRGYKDSRNSCERTPLWFSIFI